MTIADKNTISADLGAEMIARLATRVASLRKERGLPRRVLSEMSGVSPRYLAQLEAGTGNISVLLLHRVAVALDVAVEALLSEETPLDQDVQRIAALFRQAPPTVQHQVRRLLVPQNPTALRAGRICLIGLRGAGKATLGRRASKELGVPFVALDSEIERAADMPVAEILAFYGEAGFRQMEVNALARVSAQHKRVIVAVAGGIVAEEQTYNELLERFHTIWIRTSPAEHINRVRAQGEHKKGSENTAAMEQLKTLLAVRTPLYAKAEAQVNTTGRTEETSASDLLAVIEKHGFLEPKN